VGGGGATGASGSDGGALGRSVIRTVSFFRGTAEVLTVGGFGGVLSGSLIGLSVSYLAEGQNVQNRRFS